MSQSVVAWIDSPSGSEQVPARFCRRSLHSRTHACVWFASLFFLSVLESHPIHALEYSETVLFQEDTGGFKLYRIPGIVCTSNGTLLAYCEARKFTEADRGEIEIHLRRSIDGGKTWEPAKQIAHLGPRLSRNPHMPEKKKSKNMGGPTEQTVNNPVAIASRSGAVHLLYCVEYMRCFVIHSMDHGASWSSPREITTVFEPLRDRLNWQALATGPGHGIELRNGRLIAPFWMTDYERRLKLTKASSVIYSDDQGETWQTGEIAMPSGNETNIVELSTGQVMLTSRNTDPRNRRKTAVSNDSGSNWSTPIFSEDLLEPGCMAGIISHPGNQSQSPEVLLYSAPYTTQREHQARRNVSVYLSRDNGQSWPLRRTLFEGPSAYSDLAVLPDGKVVCFFEKGVEARYGDHGRPWAYRSLVVATFDLEWLQGQAVTP